MRLLGVEDSVANLFGLATASFSQGPDEVVFVRSCFAVSDDREIAHLFSLSYGTLRSEQVLA